MKKVILPLIIICTLFTSIISAHGDKHKKKIDTVTVVNGDTIAVNGIPIVDSLKAKENIITVDKDEHKEKFELNITEALFEHIHNKIIHFPIAFAILLLIFMILGYKVEICYRASKIITVLGFIVSVLAAIAGLLQASAFEETNLYGLLELHRNLAFAVIIIYGVLTWAIIKRKSWKVQFSIALILTILIIVIGFLGGIIAH